MKKNAVLFGMAALMLFSLTGCLTERHESVDSGKNVRLTYDDYAYCENGYYYRFPGTGQIFFYDLSSAQAVPLCNKPECEHTEQEQDTCNSYIRGINSFSSRNIQKTAEDFLPLSHLTLSVGIDEGITRFLSFRLADYAALLMMIIISWQLLAERKSGLWEIVHCTREGRTRLAVRRCFMLLFSSVVICIFIYGTILLASFWIYGGQNDLNRPIQSIADFQRCSLPVTIREFLLQYGMIKLLSVFLVGMIVWFFLSSFSNLSIGMVILGIFLGIEYSLFYFLPVQSIWNLLKYVNLFSYIDLFSYPWGARTFLLLLLPFFLVIVTTGCIAVNTNKKPKESSQLFIRFSSLLHILSNAILGRLSVCMLELYKVLFIKKGILVLILFFFYQYESIIGGKLFMELWNCI